MQTAIKESYDTICKLLSGETILLSEQEVTALKNALVSLDAYPHETHYVRGRFCLRCESCGFSVRTSRAAKLLRWKYCPGCGARIAPENGGCANV